MAVERITVARPYAEAIFQLAVENNAVDQWSQMLSLFSTMLSAPALMELIDNPNFDSQMLLALLISIADDRITQEGINLLKLLMENKRLTVAPEIAALYEERKNEQEGTLDVTIVSAYAINKTQENRLADALRARLGKSIHVTVEKDATLIGGLKIRAGDLVIDGSIRNKVARLATAFGI